MERASPITHVRGSLVLMSLRALRQRGLDEAYFRALPATWHEAIRSTTASVWVPIDVATAHYRACEALSLSEAIIADIGAEAGATLNQRVVAVMVRLATPDPRPWIALTKFPRLNDQLWRGGEMLVERIGDHEARVDWRGQPLADIGYFRLAYLSYVRAVLTP